MGRKRQSRAISYKKTRQFDRVRNHGGDVETGRRSNLLVWGQSGVWGCRISDFGREVRDVGSFSAPRDDGGGGGAALAKWTSVEGLPVASAFTPEMRV